MWPPGCALLRDHGQEQKYVHVVEGYNARLDTLQAGFLRVKLRHLEAWNDRRRVLAALYDQEFASLPWVLGPVMRVRPDNVAVYHLYVIHVADRDRLHAHLKARGISCGFHYPMPLLLS